MTADKPRLAISGWFHLPQKGEAGYIEGLQESLNLESSRAALADAAANVASGLGELPLPILKPDSEVSVLSDKFTDEERKYLSKYLSESYLSGKNIPSLCEEFVDSSLLELEGFLNEEFANIVKTYIVGIESSPEPQTAAEVITSSPEWSVSRPPHKHRYAYIDPTTVHSTDKASPIRELANLFTSCAFRKWITMISGVSMPTHSRVLARRFRPGLDYTLATTSLTSIDETSEDSSESSGLLEGTLCITPSEGWADGEFGAYELYMNDGTEDNGGQTDVAENDPAVYLSASRTKRAKETEEKLAPGVEIEEKLDEESDDSSSSSDDDDDDEVESESVLLTSQARWNVLTLVYRDPCVLKFVKYVSKLAPGSRWDVAGEWKPGVDAEDDAE